MLAVSTHKHTTLRLLEPTWSVNQGVSVSDRKGNTNIWTLNSAVVVATGSSELMLSVFLQPQKVMPVQLQSRAAALLRTYS